MDERERILRVGPPWIFPKKENSLLLLHFDSSSAVQEGPQCIPGKRLLSCSLFVA